MGKSEQGLKGRLIYRGQELPAEKQKQNNCLHYPEMQVEQQHKSEQGLRRCQEDFNKLVRVHSHGNCTAGAQRVACGNHADKQRPLVKLG